MISRLPKCPKPGIGIISQDCTLQSKPGYRCALWHFPENMFRERKLCTNCLENPQHLRIGFTLNYVDTRPQHTLTDYQLQQVKRQSCLILLPVISCSAL